MSAEAKQFGARVRSLRHARSLSQEAFATACNLHRTYIGSVERGERNISLSSMARIASALGVSISSMLTPEDGA